MADLNKISHARIDKHNDGLNLALLDSKSVYYGELPKRWDLTDDLVAATVLPSSHVGPIISFDAIIPEFPGGIDRIHFDVAVSSSDQAVSTGVINESLVSSRRLSDAHGGFYVETSGIYHMPTAGLPSSYSGKSVHVVISNADVDPSNPVYVYWRPRWYASDAFDSNGDFYGMGLHFVKAMSLNTGEESISNQYLSLPASEMSWPAGKDASFEVYYGSRYRDSSVNNSGFRYHDGEDIKLLPQDGIDGLLSGTGVYLLTNPMDISSPMTVRCRAKWDTGQTAWFSMIHFPEEKYSELTALYHYQERISIPKDTYIFNYHVQVILGTSPNLSDYFPGGDTSFEEPDLESMYLYEYSDSGHSSHSGRFTSMDGDYEMGTPSASGFPYDEDAVVTYVSEFPLLSDSEMYVLWRVRQAVWESYEVSGAGSASANGTYCREGLYGTRPYYSKGSWYISWDETGTMWVIGTALGAGSLPDVFCYVVDSSIVPPLVGWDSYNGALPAPTLSVTSCDPLSLPSSSSSSSSSSQSSPSSSSPSSSSSSG